MKVDYKVIDYETFCREYLHRQWHDSYINLFGDVSQKPWYIKRTHRRNDPQYLVWPYKVGFIASDGKFVKFDAIHVYQVKRWRERGIIEKCSTANMPDKEAL